MPIASLMCGMASCAGIGYFYPMADHSRTGVDWEDVRFFVGLARHRSLSATARALGVTHATVARRVTALERALGAPLFERRPDGFQLTPAGQHALDTAATMDEAAQTLRRLSPSRPLAGLLRLTATPALAEAFLIPVVAELSSLHPALDVEMDLYVRRVVVAQVSEAADDPDAVGPAGDVVARIIVGSVRGGIDVVELRIHSHLPHSDAESLAVICTARQSFA